MALVKKRLSFGRCMINGNEYFQFKNEPECIKCYGTDIEWTLEESWRPMIGPDGPDHFVMKCKRCKLTWKMLLEGYDFMFK